MSRTSINKNNQAIANINSAISKYEDAISTIKATNENESINAIVSQIDSCIASLRGAASQLSSINAQIEGEMRRVEAEEALRKKKESESDES